VCILFGIKGDWEVQKKLLIKLDEFISSLKNYEKDKIPEDRLIKLRKQIEKSEFKEEVLFKKAREVMEIAQWCKAIEKYAVVAREVEPKKRKMNELQIKLDKANLDLQTKMKILNEAEEKVQKLKN
jgi:dynein heavy chain